MIYKKYFGQVYNISAALFSWIFYFFLRDTLVSSAKVVIFYPDEIRIDILSSILILAAVFTELIGIGIKIRRIRHIKAHPEDYGDFYAPSSNSYISDFNFLHFIFLFASRLMLSILLGNVVMALLGLYDFWVLGALALVIKDILFFWIGTRNLNKPIEKRISEPVSILANVLLVFSGFIFLSVGWEAFSERFNEVLCTITNWQGIVDFIIGFILMVFFYFLLFYPTRMGYQIEEIEFTDSKEEERKLLLFYLGSILFAVIPWLI